MKRVSLVVIVLGMLLLVRILPTGNAIQAVVGWVEQLGVFAPFAFVGTYLVVTVFMLPAWPLSVAAGALFGLFAGTAAVATGATLGMAATFLIGRYLARPAVERKFRQYPRFTAIDRAVGEGGWKIVALLRLSPAVPFNLQNYLYGLTAIRLWPCILASAVAILPGTFMYVYLGYAGHAGLSAVSAAQSERGMGQWALLVIGLLATIVVTIYVTKLARRAIQEQTQVDAPSVLPDTKPDTESRAPMNPWLGAGAAATAAVVVIVAVGCAQFRSSLLARFFGPPTVSMNEAYAAKVEGPHFDHAPFDGILRKYVNDKGGVDYAGLRANPEPLREYVASLAGAPFAELGRDEKLALLINAYNSFTLELIVDWPDKDIRSIQDIPSDKRWDDKRWKIGGNVWSLNQIEHDQIRPNFREPNVHWALVCAAVGCPPLRAEAYTSAHIEDQLEDQARIVHTNGSRWFQFETEARLLRLTSLYKWYGSDFKQVAGDVLDYAARYSPELAKVIKAGQRPNIEWLDYDWALNSQENLN
ncbi:MAG: VTT domain-containing protein [Candidatus Hydrogenedentes bacterium]|nr:VTT domain-containing protein [Candidatus Hydrogenedentota bacterium]